MEEEMMNDVVSSIKACITSAPEGKTTSTKLNRDYREMVGDAIPYRSLGYNSLDKFLQDIPDIIVTRQHGDFLIEARRSAATSHIADLISNQKRAKNRKKKDDFFSYRRPSSFRSNFSRPAARPLMPKMESRPFSTNRAPRFNENKMGDNRRNDERYNSNNQACDKSNSSCRAAPTLNNNHEVSAGSTVENVNVNNNWSVPETANPPSTQPTVDMNGNDNCQKLYAYASQNKWPKPKFTIIDMKSTNVFPRRKIHLSMRCLEISSFPEEFFNVDDAKEYVAQKALAELEKLPTVTNYSVAQIEQELSNRVSSIIQDHDNGMWAYVVENNYKSKYNASMPCNWLKMLSNNVLFIIDSFGNEAHTLVKLKEKEQIPQIIYPVINLPRTTIPRTTIPKMEYPTESLLYIVISSITDVSHFSFRLREFSDQYNLLLEKMKQYYGTLVNTSFEAIKGRYAVHKSSNGAINRALVTEVRDNDEIEVEYVDTGNKLVVPLSQMRPLVSEFAELPAQAFPGILYRVYMYDIPDHDFFNGITNDTLIGKEAYSVSVNEHLHYMELYDVKDNSSYNTVILNKIVNSFLAPSLPKVGILKEALVANVSEGRIILHITSDTFHYLTSKLKMIEEEKVQSRAVKLEELSKSNVYYVKGTQIYRVQILKVISENDIEVNMIDYGCKRTFELNDLGAVDDYNDVMINIPPQFVSVKMNKVPEQALQEKDLFLSVIPSDEPVLAKVVDDKNDVVVELFMRSNNLIVSINETLCLNYYEKENELSQYVSNLSLRNAVLKKTGKVVFIEEKLGLTPPVSEINGEFFQVVVVSCATPSNFFIQPVKLLMQLNVLMNEMKVYYEQHPDLTVKTKDITKNNLYAARFSDGFWYRVFVVHFNKNNVESTAVRSCDYGNIHIVPAYDLKPLLTEYKSMPFVAINAELYGVKPKHTDWSHLEAINMRMIVDNNKFFCYIKDFKHNEETTMTTVSVVLIDTSTEKDVDVVDILLNY